MRKEITVPRMGESITSATVGQILKPSGSSVKSEEEILELETDKINQVLYAPAGGVITLTVKSEDTVTIGQVIGYVETEAIAGQEAPKPEKATVPPPVSPQPTPPPSREPSVAAVRESKADFIAELRNAPTREAVTAMDPEPRHAPVPSSSPKHHDRETRTKMSRIRRVIGERLVQAQHTTAMLTTFNEVDLTQVMELRTRFKESFQKEHGAKLGFMSFFVKAVVSALKHYPELNSYIDGEDLVHRNYYDIGIAVGTEKGLFVPVVRDCDQLTFGQIEKTIEGLARKAREGGLVIDDLSGGGFTITNGGVYGSLLSTPILNPPQSGILGMHKISERPVVVNKEIVIRPMMYTALSYDHRIVDGKGAVGFLVHIKEFLEDPARLLIET